MICCLSVVLLLLAVPALGHYYENPRHYYENTRDFSTELKVSMPRTRSPEVLFFIGDQVFSDVK
jgi:hypothetical protein